MASPFDLDDSATYAAWRAAKLHERPRDVGNLVVPIADPAALSAREHAALVDRIARANMAIYAGPPSLGDRDVPRRLAAQFGLYRLDANWLADDDGVSSIAVGPASSTRTGPDSPRGDFIPYTDRPIRWHTDGYYHPPERRIRAMVLHCVRPAASGGENALLDPELAYLLLRDEDPGYILALMQPDAMTIPARCDGDVVARPAITGPVFSVDPLDGSLHMRYTARTRSIVWNDVPGVRSAVAALARLLDGASPWVLRATLQPGMGLLCNNVLHDRSGFTDDPAQPRLIYRARFLDRIHLEP